LERGAELIGTNHPLWLAFTKVFGLGLSVVTTEDVYDTAGLNSPLYLKGQLLTAAQQETLNDKMNAIFKKWCDKAIKDVPSIYPWMPWMVPHAASLDAANLSAQIPAGTPPDVV